ncbi:MAG: hypothetical protein E7256_10340 [Lachnospiraceae bacterium]|nr:hypothetical protein [Lachnospiraceae bacterium]
MFSANLKEMMQSYEALQGYLKVLKRELEEVTNISVRISSLSQMEEPYRQLCSIKEELTAEYNALRQMIRVLDKIALHYAQCEERLKKEYENSAVCYEKKNVRYISLNDVGELLKDIVFK